MCNKSQQKAQLYVNVLIQLQCLRHVSNIQVFIVRKTCTCNLKVFLSYIHISSLVDGTMCFDVKVRFLLALITQVYGKALFKKRQVRNPP
jgi:hypothetical protein